MYGLSEMNNIKTQKNVASRQQKQMRLTNENKEKLITHYQDAMKWHVNSNIKKIQNKL